VVTPPPVWGFASTVFGATAAVSKLRDHPKGILANALSLAGIISPVNSAAAWRQHAPATTIKYMLGGWLCHGALTAAHMAEFGHRGDPQIFDPEYGYPRFIGTTRWEPAKITEGLGAEWNFVRELSFKPYPHCRVLHAPLDALRQIVEENDLKPDEIEGITAWVEGFVERPIWMNRSIEDVTDAQFSIAHGLALGAHRLEPGPAWQEHGNVYAPSVMDLLHKVRHVVHPDYVKSLSADGGSRPSRVEVQARGQVFSAERSHPKGSGLPGSDGYMTTEELVDKFTVNAQAVLTSEDAERLAEAVLGLAEVADIRDVMRLASPEMGGRGEVRPGRGVA
jgi:2-methylcitrate dehydratase PrpD